MIEGTKRVTHKVPKQLQILAPAGKAVIIVKAEKYAVLYACRLAVIIRRAQVNETGTVIHPIDRLIGGPPKACLLAEVDSD